MSIIAYIETACNREINKYRENHISILRYAKIQNSKIYVSEKIQHFVWLFIFLLIDFAEIEIF